MSFRNVLKLFLITAIFLFVGSSVHGADYSLRFDGIDDTVYVPYDIVLNPTSMSIESWINLTDWNYAGGWSTIVVHGDYDNYSFYVFNDESYPQGLWYEIYEPFDRGAGVNNVFELEKWYHVVGTYNGTTTKIYVNGVEVQSSDDTYMEIAQSSFPIGIGGRGIPTGHLFEGLIDNVKIYNRALIPTEVVSAYNGTNITSGLVGHWDFNEGQGSVAYDSSGFGNNGNITGAVYEKKANVIFVSPATMTTMLAFVGDLFTDLELIIIFTIGVPLAFYVIKRVISLV